MLTSALSWRYGFFLNVPVGLAAILAAPRVLAETGGTPAASISPGRSVARSGVSALVFGIVHSADAGWGAGRPSGALAAGVALLVLFVVNQRARPSR